MGQRSLRTWVKVSFPPNILDQIHPQDSTVRVGIPSSYEPDSLAKHPLYSRSIVTLTIYFTIHRDLGQQRTAFPLLKSPRSL